MPDALDTQNDISVWCAGLPLESRRPLTPDEHTELQQEARRYLWCGVAAVALIPTLPFAFMLICALASRLSISEDVSAGVAVFVGLIFLALVILKANDWLRLWRQVRRDLKAGAVSRFVGSAGPLAGPQVLDVLDGSDRLWRRALSPVPQGIILPRTEAAATPAFAAIAAEWVQPMDATQPDTPYVSDREMKDAEREEVAGLIRDLRWNDWVVLIALNLWVLVLIIGATDGRPGLDGGSVVLGVLILGVTIWRDAQWVQALWLAFALQQDARTGRIVIARMPLPAERGILGAPALSAPEEFLPHSQVPWTVDGQPAPWRRGTQVRQSRRPG